MINVPVILATIFIAASLLQTAAAYTQEEVDFASGLEETLGHFRAMELNLDDRNAELALIHATHPISELYDSLKPQLVATNPALDNTIRTTLEELKDKATVDVSRAQAQAAINDAKDIIEQARIAVVSQSSIQDPEFQLELIKILLETSVAEYYEAVEDGMIGNMPEFQDGSAFVWRSQVLFEEQRSYLGSKAGIIDDAYADLDVAYNTRADPSEVDLIVDRILAQIGDDSEDDLLVYVDTIKTLLQDTKSQYRSGDADLALSSATRAYLDNYEFLEQPLIEADQRELMEEIEVMMREDLRDIIKNGVGPDEIDRQVDAILIKMNTVSSILLGASTYTQDQVDFASGLEETLGHFRAMELNLDDRNAELALIHATHPISELYDSLKPQLVATNPALDNTIRTTLEELKDKATVDVSRAQAQAAINDAKDIIEQARIAVVPAASLNDPKFQLELIQILLETSVAEYYEAVEDGMIGNMPEFQDGSAFVWRSQVLFEEQRSYLGADKSAKITAAYSEVSRAYDNRADPAVVEAVVDKILVEISTTYTQEEVDFASGLEETLGHFRAMELNLDDRNAELALIHATHPISELYDSLKPQLVATNPALDNTIRTTLEELKDKATVDVSRAQAQAAINDAKDIIEQARIAVVSQSSIQDPEFQLELIKILLETSVAEYYEAVEDGMIGNMPEFQDGSAFVWRSQVLFEEQRSYLGSKAGIIDDAYADLDVAYNTRADPSEVDLIVDRILAQIGDDSEDDLLVYVDTIKTLLQDTKSQYRSGDADLALSSATRAYLDNYEFLEQPLIEADQRELMEEIEVMMREELRDMIRDGASPDDVDAQVDAILIKMDAVEKIVPEFGVMVLVVLIVATSAVILLTRHSKIIKNYQFN